MDELEPTLRFFGLREQPFAATADPAYFYATRAHRECLYRLWNSIDGRHGIAVVLGSYGTGKTTLLRKLLTGMKAEPDRYNTAVIGSPIPSWTSFALLDQIVTQIGLRPPKRSFMAYMDELNKYLISNRNRINTLIIDDAQNLNKRGQLELLRLVQNLETPQHKLLNLVLFAQMEWMQILASVPNFEQRINMTFTFEALSEGDIRNLIQFRLAQAGAQGANVPVFDDLAIRCIHAYAEGSPRVSITVCRNALMVAARLKTRHITAEVIVHTIEKTTLPDRTKRARVASVFGGAPQSASTPAAMMVSDPAPRREPVMPASGISRDERARQMLLRSGRGKPVS